MRKLNLFFFGLLLINLVYAVEMNDTLIYNTVTNYSTYINSTIYFDKLVISDAGRIEFYNLTSNQTFTPILYNINNTYESIIDFYGLTNALITKSNGSVACPNIYDCTGNINTSIPLNGWIKVYNNYSVATGDTPTEPREDEPIYQGTSGTGRNQSTKLNTTLTMPVTMNISGLTNALIFNNSGGVRTNFRIINDNDGIIEITIGVNETIYILNNYDVEENYIRYLDPIWFSLSTSTEKHIGSNLTSSVNVSVTVNVIRCDTVGSLEYTPEGGTKIIIESGGYTCSGNVLTIPSLQINTAAASNVLKINYNAAIQGICDESDAAFLQAVGLIGLILTIILVGGVIGIVVLALKGYIDVDIRAFSWGEIIGAVLIIGLTGLIIATMAYLIGGRYCIAIGG